MKDHIKMRFRLLALVLAGILLLAACAQLQSGAEGKSPASQPASQPQPAGSEPAPAPLDGPMIYLYGERHGLQKILERENELWYHHYHEDGMRHLFVELSYYTAEFLNLWMQAEDDTILDALYDDWEGTAVHTPQIKDFYWRIKEECPETVFHGTDVGHQSQTTGERYLALLREQGREDSEEYRLARENVQQGETYYSTDGDVYRENTMVENFIAAYEKLPGERIMGIYGAAHILLEASDSTGTVPCMANQLKERLGDVIAAESLVELSKETQPQRMDVIRVGEKEYEASYFGSEDLTGFQNFTQREFWRLENAYDDFRESPGTGDQLPYDNYPMAMEEGQVYVVDYTMTDGSVMRLYYRSDGEVWQGRPSTQSFSPD